MSGLMQFKPVLFKGQLYTEINIFMPIPNIFMSVSFVVSVLNIS